MRRSSLLKDLLDDDVKDERERVYVQKFSLIHFVLLITSIYI